MPRILLIDDGEAYEAAIRDHLPDLRPAGPRQPDGPAALAWLTAHGPSVSLPRVIFGTNFLLAVASPVVLFAHAGYVLRDARSALLAAALVALFRSRAATPRRCSRSSRRR